MPPSRSGPEKTAEYRYTQDLELFVSKTTGQKAAQRIQLLTRDFVALVE